MSAILSSIQTNNFVEKKVVLTQAQYEELLLAIARAKKQRKYIKKYHKTPKGKEAKARAQRRYRAKLRAQREQAMGIVAAGVP